MLKQELTFKATEVITPLYLYATNVLITYSDISLKEVVKPQAVTPPDPTKVLLYNEIACLGHPDNVTLHHATVEGHTTINTPKEIQDAYDTWVSENYALLTDSGDVLVNNAGNTIVTI